MKKFTLFVIAFFVASAMFAQNAELTRMEIGGLQKAIKSHASIKTPTDTIFMYEWMNAATAAYNYLAPGSGYILGPHWDTAGNPRSSEQAQGYLNLGSGYGIESVLIWTGIKYQYSLNGSKLFVKVAKIDDTESYTIGGTPYNINCPGTVIGSDTIEWVDIDTSSAGWTIANFNPPAYVAPGVDYAVIYNVSDFYTNGDTVSVIGGADAGSGVYGPEYTYYRYPTSPPLWTQFDHIWTSGGNPIDMAIAIFPVVDETYINVGDAGFANHMQLSQNYPNPSDGSTSISYALEVDANVIFEVFDIKGNKVVNMSEGHKTAGTYTINLGNQLAPGIYYYSLVAGKHRLTKKMCVK